MDETVATENHDELLALNVDDLDVEELEQRLELDAAVAGCDCSWNDCSTYCNPPK